MQDIDTNLVSEVVELSNAVFSNGRKAFEEEYGGEIDNYMLVQDLRNRIEEAMIDRGGDIPYMDELPSFSDLGDDEESWANVFYSLTPDKSYSELADISDFSSNQIDQVLEDLEEEGMIESKDNTKSAKYFYGENAMPYLMVFSEAEMILEDRKAERSETEVEPEPEVDNTESYDETKTAITDVQEESEQEADEDKSLQDIMMDVAEDEEDLKTTVSQRDDGGVESRDHTDTDVDDESSNPGEDEYYEGW